MSAMDDHHADRSPQLITELILQCHNASDIETNSSFCAGCSRNIKSTADNSDPACQAGCLCLMCPNWFVCPDCAAEHAQAHRVSHLNHITYSISDEDETNTRNTASHPEACAPMKPLAFVVDTFFAPLCRMFLPVLTLWMQVFFCTFRDLDHVTKNCNGCCST